MPERLPPLASGYAAEGPGRIARAGVAGHFGELIQGKAGKAGKEAVLALVTLPCPVLSTSAVWQAEARAPLRIEGVRGGEWLHRIAQTTLLRLGAPRWGGRIVISSTCPPLAGAGHSTGAALALLRAITGHFGFRMTPEEEAALCVRAEGATDPLMYPAPERVIWAPRRAQIVALLPPPPALLAVGGFDGQGMPTRPEDEDFPALSHEFDAMERAFAAQDGVRIGALASLSAQANQSRNPKPHWAEIRSLSAESEALGVAAAHTGSAVALLFLPHQRGEAAFAARAMRKIGLTGVARFAPFS